MTAPALGAALTDGAGRQVEMPVQIGRIAPAGPPAQVLLQALVPERLVGLVEPFDPDHAIYIDAALERLPRIPMLSRSDAPQDIAAVAALKPDLVVDYGSIGKRYVAATERVAGALKVPAAIFDGSLAHSGEVVRTLGAALGANDRATALDRVIAQALDQLKPLADLPDSERPAVYIARGPDGLEAIRAGSSLDETVRLAGGRNVVEGSGGTFRHLAAADVAALKPAVVIVGDVGALSGPLRAALPAATTFVLDAGEPYPVVVGPPSLNRVVGALALAAILHPDNVKADPDNPRRLETTLFPIPPGLAVPSPLQVRK